LSSAEPLAAIMEIITLSTVERMIENLSMQIIVAFQ
jgi:hypothetical protein